MLFDIVTVGFFLVTTVLSVHILRLRKRLRIIEDCLIDLRMDAKINSRILTTWHPRPRPFENETIRGLPPNCS